MLQRSEDDLIKVSITLRKVFAERPWAPAA